MQRVKRAEVIGSKNKRRLVTRELYLRDDIPCRSMLCIQCKSSLPALLSSSGTNNYIIPDVSFVLHFLEILESPTVNNIIILETVFKQLKSRTNAKFMNRINKLLHNPIKCCISFPNETCQETFTPREMILQENRNGIRVPEPLDLWILRSLRNAANWYYQHLSNIENRPIIKLVRADLEKSSEKLPAGATTFQEISIDELTNELSDQDNELPMLLESLREVRETEQNSFNENNTDDSEFSEHLPSDAIEAGIKSGILYKGKIQVNKFATQEAFVSVSSSVASSFDEIFIPNNLLRNRAIHGDIVAVEILPNSQWTAPRRNAVKTDKPDDTGVVTVSEDEEKSNSTNNESSCATGRVVGIVQRNWRLYSATLQPSDRSDSRRRILVPIDIRIPKIRVSTRQGNDLSDKRLAVRLDDWPRTSQYPNGHYVSILGDSGDIDAETKVLMVENEIALERRFSPGCMAHLPATEKDWVITEEDVKQRRDLRSRLVMSIDPPGCEDIDDALSVYEVPEKYKGRRVLEIGVHIADVTHFVPHNSLLDREARERGTTVYLADRRMDMLPLILSGQLCSLHEGIDRFAMSVLWTVDAESFDVLDTWYGKTIIHSSHEFSYQTADAIINNKLDQKERKSLSNKTGRQHEYEIVRTGLLQLLEIARNSRKFREEKGTLELHSTEVRFEMTEQKKPTEVKIKQTLEVMKMVEEYMVQANQSVAERIFRSFPSSALLRRHPFPRESDFRPLIDAAASLGFTIDASSNKTLADSLNKCVVPGEDVVNNILRLLAVQAMSEAAYISSGDYETDEFYHYGLAAEFYTHFTSPIRRYADVIVHRLLEESIKKEKLQSSEPKTSPHSPGVLLNQKQIEEICSHINIQNRNAKLASMDSSRLFHGLFFKAQEENLGNPVVAEGVVYAIRSSGFVVYVPKYGVKGVVYLADSDGNSLIPRDAISSRLKKYQNVELTGTFEHDRSSDLIRLDSSSGPIEVSRFSYCSVAIGVRESPIRWPTITLKLLKINMEAPRAKIETIKVNELSAKTKEVANANLKKRNEALMQGCESPEFSQYSQTPKKQNIYLMFEQFRNISL